MTRYHINPNTGNPNICTGKVKCKFTSEEGVEPPHYETKIEAQKPTEKQIIATSSRTQALKKTYESDEELRGSENLEKAIKFARKLDNSIAQKRPIYRAKLKGLREKAFSVIKLFPRPNQFK
jgi:hypothetical protein